MPISSPEDHLPALRYLLAVAEEGHFGRAAVRMHVLQPSVSQAASRLERQFGTQLLDRLGARIVPTEAGERVLEELRASLRHLLARHLLPARRRVRVPLYNARLIRAHRGAHAPFSRDIELLDSIPGVDQRAAEMLLAEIGPDMSRFPSEHHLASVSSTSRPQRHAPTTAAGRVTWSACIF